MKANIRKDECEEEGEDFLIPETICLQAKPEELKELIKFIEKCIELMEKYDDFDHRHLIDFQDSCHDRSWSLEHVNDVDVIIASSKEK